MRLVLDAEALTAAQNPGHAAQRTVFQAMAAAERLDRQVVICAVTLAELYRGPARTTAVDRFLASSDGQAIVIRHTDRSLARLVGSAMTAAGVASDYLADAHTVAAAVEGGGGAVMTGDPTDIQRLADNFRNVTVVALPGVGTRPRRRAT